MMIKRRKNFLPSIILAILLWGMLAGLVIWVDPELVKDILLPGVYLPFFLIFFPAGLLTLSLLFGNSGRGILAALGLNIFLLLRIFGFGNWLNLVLIAGIVVAIDRLRAR